jgi:hypothetical protein
MTEEERAARIEALRARRGGEPTATRPAGGSDADALTTSSKTSAPQHRRSRDGSVVEDTLTSGVSSTEMGTRALPDSASVARTPRPPSRGNKRSHRAEASRVAAIGAGVSLTFSLMAMMARADTVPASVSPTVESTESTLGMTAATAPSSPVAADLAPATRSTEIPVILTPIQTRTLVVRAAIESGSSGRGGGGTPVANPNGGGGGTSVQAAPAPAPAPPPPTSTRGSQ